MLLIYYILLIYNIMTGCGCDGSLVGGKKRRQIGKRTRKSKHYGGGWYDDLKSKLTGTPSDPYAPSWWDNLKNKFNSATTESSTASDPYVYNPPASNVSTAYGGKKSRKHRVCRGGSSTSHKSKHKKGRKTARRNRK
jgi:hypothetical protein